MRPHHRLIPMLAAATVVSSAGVARGGWTEAGDAGQLPGTAQSVTGSGLLSMITGELGTTDADMFAVFISGAFTATTVDTPGSLADTQLFLFDSDGYGVLGNDDANSGTLRSTLSGSLDPGIYYLAISAFNRDPFNAHGLIFPDLPRTDLHGPDGSGGAFPVTSWSDSPRPSGTYQINLSGVSVVPLPPAALAGLSGLAGVLALGALRRRRGER